MTQPPPQGLPSFLILGAEKAGTTWLHAVLNRHPDVFLPDIKELHFFNQRNSNGRMLANYERGLNWYARHFTDRGAALAWGDATPLYLCDTAAPQRIRLALPQARLLIVLRNPIERAWSHFKMATAKGHMNGPLAARLADSDPRLIARGTYARDIRRWRSLFPHQQLHIAFFEDLIGPDGPMELAKIARHIGVCPDLMPGDALSSNTRNAATTYRSAWAYNASVSGARALRQFPATAQLARRMKASGVYDLLKRANRSAAPAMQMPPDLRHQLRSAFADDVHQLRRDHGLTPPWPDFAPENAAAC